VPKESFKIENTFSTALVNMPVHSPIMLALCSILLVTYYASNYAGIIGLGLPAIKAGYLDLPIVNIW